MFLNAMASPVIFCWALQIVLLEFDLLYIKKDNNIVADALSRIYTEKLRFLQARAATLSKRIVYLTCSDMLIRVSPEATVLAVRVNTLELGAGFES
jgi:hypothetical protein